MDFAKFVYDNGRYRYVDGSNLKMDILGGFLATDVGSIGSSFKEFAFNEWETETASNITFLRKENGKILLSDLYSEEDVPTELAMTLSQYVQFLDEWENEICKKMPKEVVIKCDGYSFTIEAQGLVEMD